MAVVNFVKKRTYEIKKIYNLKTKYRLIIQCVDCGFYRDELEIAEINKNRIDDENHPLHRYEDVEDFYLICLEDKRSIERVILIKNQNVFKLKS